MGGPVREGRVDGACGVVHRRAVSHPILHLQGVSAAYAGAGKDSISDVTLTLAPGELVGVLGPNGAGKSTLGRVASGELRATAGAVLFDGQPIGRLGRRTIAQRIAVVPQDDEVAFDFTVRDVVRMGRAPHQSGWLRSTREDEAIVDEELERADLTTLAEVSVQSLSGGERKRVAIARALAQRTPVLVLDEPTAHLDIAHGILLFDRLAQNAQRDGTAILVVMHDLNVAAQYASRVVLMKGGRVVANGAIEEVFTYRRLQEVFDADLYVGVNDLTGARFFLPMRGRVSRASLPESTD